MGRRGRGWILLSQGLMVAALLGLAVTAPGEWATSRF